MIARFMSFYKSGVTNADPVNGQRSLGAHLSAGGSHRQVGPACQFREKEKEKKNTRRRAESLHGLLFLLGLLGRTQPILLSSFSFSSHPAAADSPVPRVGDSWISCGSFLIRCELQRVCACVCVGCQCTGCAPRSRRERDVAARARSPWRKGEAGTTFHGDGGSAPVC